MLQIIKPIAEAHNATLAQLIINWTTRQPAMDCVLVGARDEGQVMDNVKSLTFTLSDGELKKIRECAENVKLVDP